jgi:hypothetical protein
MVPIDLVIEAGDSFEFDIELKDLVQVADAGRVNFQFQHGIIVGGRRGRCKI